MQTVQLIIRSLSTVRGCAIKSRVSGTMGRLLRIGNDVGRASGGISRAELNERWVGY